MLHMEIDGEKFAVEEGAMVIEAAEAAGIYIPRFCYHKKLSVAASCRMCLVEVERVAKPVPACSTPVTEGMRVFTHSAKAVGAQKGVMEFLLINHPLDCPICDQGGECELQDLAVGYGRDASRYREPKRIIKDQNIGPLIATDMTRCIQCTRCVRFGQEIGGMMELGATGRGERMLIGTYVESTVDSELSGNMIDLCPVGALTSKPFRYTARSWELAQHDSVSPHDCVGANLIVETRHGRVMRVLPRENEAVNEVWIADRDRFSYTALNTATRLRTPMIRGTDGWQEADWPTALNRAAAGLRAVIANHGADALGALASPQLTLEEGFLLQRLIRGLGSENIDHRLREADFRDDATTPFYPGLGHAIAELESRDAVLLIGSNIRKDQPLLGHRLRKAFLDGARIAAINPLDFSFTFDLDARIIVPPAQMPVRLALVALAMAERLHRAPPPELLRYAGGRAPGRDEDTIAALLCGGKRPSILLGPLAMTHPQAAELRALAALVTDMAHAHMGYLPYGSAASAWLAGVVPHRGPQGVARPVMGRSARAMLEGAMKGFLLVDAEPGLDSHDGRQARATLASAECVVALSAFQTEVLDYAHVLLPMAPFTETDGTFVNGEGRWQSFAAAATPLGDTRPGWKILRVLAGLLGVHDCEFDSTEQIRALLGNRSPVPQVAGGRWPLPAQPSPGYPLERIATISLYDTDSLVRRSPPLQATADRMRPAVYVNAAQAQRLGLAAGDRAVVTMGAVATNLEVRVDPQVPDGAVWIPAALPETADLPLSGAVTVIRA